MRSIHNKLTNSLALFIITLLAVLIFNTCKENPTETPSGEITLIVEDVSCVEAFINIKLNGIALPADVVLTRNNVNVQNFVITTNDTLIIDENLFPKQSYTYIAAVTSGTKQKSSKPVTTQTMDTTSHNFTWQTFTFGQHSSSTLYDVAIINENNIWAVGEIYMNDSLGNIDYHAYNAVHWNGSEWKLKRIMFYTICGQASLSSYPAKAIFAFSENDIWIAGGGRQLARINGINQVDKICMPFSMVINKIWGSSSNDLYVVGNGGNIAHYNGSSWRKIESPIGTGGTTLNINDIWGDFNEKTQEWEILAVCGNILHGLEQDRAILKIVNETQSIQINPENAKWPLSGIWFKPNKKYYVVGSGIYNKYRLVDLVWDANLFNITSFHTNKIKGNNINDIIIVGAYGETLHYNGFTWRSYMNETALSNGTFLSVDIKNNLIMAVGYKSARAVLMMGYR